MAIFALTWNLMHKIDETSPLHGLSPDLLSGEAARLIVMLEARDPELSATVYDMRDYGASQILFGMRYQDAVTVDEKGRTNVDLNRISAVEPDAPDGDEPNFIN